MLRTILQVYGLDPDKHQIDAYGSGLINHTWKVTGAGESFILQRINNDVFTRPQYITDNLEVLAKYLKNTAPSYLFAAPLPTVDGKYLVESDEGFFRLAPFVTGSHTLDFLTKSGQAYEAAKQFGKFTFLLKDFKTDKLKHTLADFHDLGLRIQQFKQALANATQQLKTEAANQIEQVQQHFAIADLYQQIKTNKEIPLRVIHHDTKINNVLFNNDDIGLGIIDLDTVMPGYYISDVGDMMRTYLAEANEEELDLDKIVIRDAFFVAIYAGYVTYMGGSLTRREKELFIYSGKFMIYMQAVRFLTDFLNGDIYYGAKYPGHNLARAKNQLRLLDLYLQAEPKFERMIKVLGTQVGAADMASVYQNTWVCKNYLSLTS